MYGSYQSENQLSDKRQSIISIKNKNSNHNKMKTHTSVSIWEIFVFEIYRHIYNEAKQ